MACNNSSEGLGDDFLEQILAVPSAYANSDGSGLGLGSGSGLGSSSNMPPNPNPMLLQLGSGGMGIRMPLRFLTHSHDAVNIVDATNNPHLHLNTPTTTSSSSSSTSGITTAAVVQQERDSVHRTTTGLFQAFGPLHVRPQLQLHHHHQAIPSQPPNPAVPSIRPRVRARRGQATDPHSIAERLRRERIADRMKALQELVPSANKTDRAAMLDEIVDYVKFLRLQVKVLSMSRLGGAGAVAQLVADVPLSAVESEGIESGGNEQAWEKWCNDGTEQEVAKLMEEDVGAAMQFLQSKALCIMPISLASAIFRTPQSDASTLIKPQSNTQS